MIFKDVTSQSWQDVCSLIIGSEGCYLSQVLTMCNAVSLLSHWAHPYSCIEVYGTGSIEFHTRKILYGPESN